MKWVNRYKLLISEASEGILIVNKDGEIIEANHCIEKMTGFGAKELKKSDFFRLLQCEKEEDRCSFKCLKDGEACLFEANLKQKNSCVLNVEISARRFRDGDIATFVRDITQRKKTLESIKYHAFLLENLREAVISTDRDYKITMWNKAAEALYGWTEAEVLGKRPLDVIKTEFTGVTKPDVYDILDEDMRWVGEVSQYTKSGEKKHVFSSVELIKNERGHISGAIAINIDVTEKVQYEKKLEQHYEKLKQIAWLQSHQVRAPLTNILGIVGLLDYENETKESNKLLLAYLKTSAQKLDSIIREITALTINGREVTFKKSRFDSNMAGFAD